MIQNIKKWVEEFVSVYNEELGTIREGGKQNYF